MKFSEGVDDSFLTPLRDEVKPLFHVELKYLCRALVTLNWNRTQTANALGISVRTIRTKMNDLRKLGLPTNAEEYLTLMISLSPDDVSGPSNDEVEGE